MLLFMVRDMYHRKRQDCFIAKKGVPDVSIMTPDCGRSLRWHYARVVPDFYGLKGDSSPLNWLAAALEYGSLDEVIAHAAVEKPRSY